MKKDYLQYAEQCQMQADNMAYQLLKAQKLSVIQSICNFNIAFIDNLSPVFVRSLDFFYENVRDFKRKLTLKEFLYYDYLVYWNGLKTVKELKKLL